MRRFRRLAAACVLSASAIAHAQISAAAASASAGDSSTTDLVTLTCGRASTWTAGNANIVQLENKASIVIDDTTISADRAVLWITPVAGGKAEEQQCEIALLGNAKVVQAGIERSGDRLLVSLPFHGTLRLTADSRVARDDSAGATYRDALALQPKTVLQNSLGPTAAALVPPVNSATTLPTSAPASQPVGKKRKQPILLHADTTEITKAGDGHVALLLTGNVELLTDAGGRRVELQADRAVVYTQLNSLRDLEGGGEFETINDAVYGAYLEGDVRINGTNSIANIADQRLRASRVYYEFATDRAVLTDVVIHTVDPKITIPVIVRAEQARQLSVNEFTTQHVELTTSSFAVPSFSVRASRAYVRSVPTGDVRFGNRTTFAAANSTFSLFHIPVFYLPYTAGTMTDRGFPLRQASVGQRKDFGFNVQTEFGLLESLGIPPRETFDASYKLDYFQDRGFAAGLDAEYSGGFVTENSKQPWDFSGRLRSYFVFNDEGTDKLGRKRGRVEPDDTFRGRILFEHQHFFPDGYQAQVRGAWVSDGTFLERWFEREFETEGPEDVSVYIKRQRGSEAFSILGELNPSDVPTQSSDLNNAYGSPLPLNGQGNFHPATVERLPELAYRRIGDSLGDDSLTFFSNNTVGAYRFNETDQTLADLGFKNGSIRPNGVADSAVIPGVPTLGTTGLDGTYTYRGDFRQEIDAPLTAGNFRILPYVMGRYTSYSRSPDDGAIQRVIVGTGVRVNTTFSRIDNTVQSELLDIHRLRHVIEPEIHAFTSISTTDNDPFIYDTEVDRIKDISAVQLALRQTWQTKRGGPGRWRSVDVFALNVELNLFANQYDDNDYPPSGFRGLFFQSIPEASLARSGVNVDALWRLSDTTIILADTSWSLEEQELATSSIGVAVQRDTRLSYFAGLRYIGQLNDTIASLAASYQISTKYTVAGTYSFNFSNEQSQDTSFSIIRKFDRFFLTFSTYYDPVNDQSGFSFGLYPEGFNYGLSSGALEGVLATQQ